VIRAFTAPVATRAGHLIRVARFIVVLVFLLPAACGRNEEPSVVELTGGDPGAGREAITRYACGTCHEIPGIDGANGMIGPSLAGIADRTVLAGQLPNRPDNMIRWIRDPQSALPGTAMPDLDVSEKDGRDIAAYLYTLQAR
jgi:cytochrome c